MQCVLVATTLLHSGAKFHSFLYISSKTVHVSMKSCYGGMSTRLKQCAVTEFLSAENVMPAEIHRRLQAVNGENTVNRTTVNRWAIKFRECEPGRANIGDQPRSGRLVVLFNSEVDGPTTLSNINLAAFTRDPVYAQCS